jgi:hypothetical protein
MTGRDIQAFKIIKNQIFEFKTSMQHSPKKEVGVTREKTETGKSRLE